MAGLAHTSSFTYIFLPNTISLFLFLSFGGAKLSENHGQAKDWGGLGGREISPLLVMLSQVSALSPPWHLLDTF